MLGQFDVVATRLLGEPAQRLGRVAAAAVRGTIDGLLLIGIGEAALLGIAYAVSGVPHPVTLGVLTGVLSAIPFPSPVVFIGAAALPLTQSAPIEAIGLFTFVSITGV